MQSACEDLEIMICLIDHLGKIFPNKQWKPISRVSKMKSIIFFFQNRRVGTSGNMLSCNATCLHGSPPLFFPMFVRSCCLFPSKQHDKWFLINILAENSMDGELLKTEKLKWWQNLGLGGWQEKNSGTGAIPIFYNWMIQVNAPYNHIMSTLSLSIVLEHISNHGHS
jgi:hypothetical protein